jgi:hypothetical protein
VLKVSEGARQVVRQAGAAADFAEVGGKASGRMQEQMEPIRCPMATRLMSAPTARRFQREAQAGELALACVSRSASMVARMTVTLRAASSVSRSRTRSASPVNGSGQLRLKLPPPDSS